MGGLARRMELDGLTSSAEYDLLMTLVAFHDRKCMFLIEKSYIFLLILKPNEMWNLGLVPK